MTEVHDEIHEETEHDGSATRTGGMASGSEGARNASAHEMLDGRLEGGYAFDPTAMKTQAYGDTDDEDNAARYALLPL